MSDEAIIRHCAPTLAGLKTGSIFLTSYESKEALRASIRLLNRRLSPKGLRVVPLRCNENRALIYVYRPRKLTQDLSQNSARQLLRSQGYRTDSCEGCLVQLARKLRQQGEFPHEIGLFLGYPVEDVHGFMENRTCGCKCVGCWKVYGDEASARKRFAQYKKCTRVYQDCWAKGTDIERLTVAG